MEIPNLKTEVSYVVTKYSHPDFTRPCVPFMSSLAYCYAETLNREYVRIRKRLGVSVSDPVAAVYSSVKKPAHHGRKLGQLSVCQHNRNRCVAVSGDVSPRWCCDGGRLGVRLH
ncbi:hypothetical protein BaRGS_00033367 [Batillaria attramentaria]|uniref:Uncharacterized protein n=1 Tax=Batillaria attramentaria TaxID=370345 RepID=A0ABD0JK66_9CAEN